jgi:hypothetical protein
VAGRNENRSKPEKMTISLPGDVHKYLIYLASIGKKGVTENEVAVHILVDEVERMQREDFDKVRSPEPQK